MKLLLLSDETMNPNGGGISQTLYNIFSFIRPENLLCVVPESILKVSPPAQKYRSSYISYRFEIVATPQNRLAKYVNSFITWMNFSYNSRFRNFKNIKARIREFEPTIIVSCSNGAVGLFMHHQLVSKANVAVFPYFMDDWVGQKHSPWLGKKIDQWTKKILADNPNWLMISAYLAQIFRERYHIMPERVLEIHNPVDLSKAPAVAPLEKKPEYEIAYAGALWPMHFDAFTSVLRAIETLKNRLNVKLVLYTSQNMWNWRKEALQSDCIRYGGSIPYEQIHDKLSKADALLVVSSFEEEWQSHSKSSLQTKITDYLLAKRLVISCAPSYAVNNHFLKMNHCGVCIESNDIESIAAALFSIFSSIENYNSYIDNGYALLEKEYSFERVHTKLVDFLSFATNKSR